MKKVLIVATVVAIACCTFAGFAAKATAHTMAAAVSAHDAAIEAATR